ncbi:MAG: malonyl-CoA decarboxylase family protein, partial [Pseudomonadota bacterium]
MTTSMGYLGKVLEQGRRLAVKPFSIGSREDLDTSISGLQKKCAAVLSSRGQASGARTAAQVLEIYEQYEDDDKEAFFDVLLADFSQDKDQLVDACRTYSADPTQEHLQALAGFMEPERQELFRRLNLVPGGTACLVQMRQDLLKILPRRPDLKPVDQDFLHLFRSWFNRGFLTLRPVSWSSPAIVLERLIKYEAVHEIDGWGDLKNRLDPEDRYCYAFFHPNLVNDPLIFVEVALCREIPSSVQNILRDDREHLKAEDASVAAFYSISNCQKGLQGISFGNFLIKQVVENLRV